MDKKHLYSLALVVVLISLVGGRTGVQSVEVQLGTIYIRADGTVEGTSDISTFDNVTYTITGNINGSILVEKDNVIIEGAGYVLQGSGNGSGITLSARRNITIKSLKIKTFEMAIYLADSSNNTICGNLIEANGNGIRFSVHATGSNNNSVCRNNITHNNVGILLYNSLNNTIYENNFTNNYYGIQLQSTISLSSSNNKVFHNNFINNAVQAIHTRLGDSQLNIWDDDYPSGGNYWSDYEARYPNAADTDDSGIWNVSYTITGDNSDNYPLVEMIPEYPALIVLPLFMCLTLLAALTYQRKRR